MRRVSAGVLPGAAIVAGATLFGSVTVHGQVLLGIRVLIAWTRNVLHLSWMSETAIGGRAPRETHVGRSSEALAPWTAEATGICVFPSIEHAP